MLSRVRCSGAEASRPNVSKEATGVAKPADRSAKPAGREEAAAPPPPPPPTASASAASPPASSPASDLSPGTYEELHKKCRDVFPMAFDGAKVMLSKGLSNHFQVSHTITMAPTGSGYRMGATYVGANQLSPQEAFPVLLGDTDVNGNTSATLLHHFANTNLRCKVQSQIAQGRWMVFQAMGEWRPRLVTATLTVANPDLVANSGVVIGQYLRRVMRSPCIDMGCELVYQYGRQVPGGLFSNLQYAARFTAPNYALSAAVGRHAAQLCYYHKQLENLSFGVDWEMNFRQMESTATIGYQYEMAKAGLSVRASVDSEWTVSAVAEKKLQPLPFTLALSGLINHRKAQSRFGIGLMVG